MGDTWKPIILFYLLRGRMRFSDLGPAIPSVAQRMLTLQLRELEDDRIITRTVYPEVPPRVEYELTELGRSLEPILISMRDWGQAYSGLGAMTDRAEPAQLSIPESRTTEI